MARRKTKSERSRELGGKSQRPVIETESARRNVQAITKKVTAPASEVEQEPESESTFPVGPMAPAGEVPQEKQTEQKEQIVTREQLIGQYITPRQFVSGVVAGGRQRQALEQQYESIDPNRSYKIRDPETGRVVGVSGVELRSRIREQIEQQSGQRKQFFVSGLASSSTRAGVVQQTSSYPSGTRFVVSPTGQVSPDMRLVSDEDKIAYYKSRGVFVDPQSGERVGWQEYKSRNPASFMVVQDGRVRVVNDYMRWNEERYRGADPAAEMVSRGLARFLGGFASPEFIIETVGRGGSGDEIIARWEYEQQQRRQKGDVVGFVAGIPVVSNVFVPAATGFVATKIIGMGSQIAGVIARQGFEKTGKALSVLGKGVVGGTAVGFTAIEAATIASLPDDKKLERILTTGTQFASFYAGAKLGQKNILERRIDVEYNKMENTLTGRKYLAFGEKRVVPVSKRYTAVGVKSKGVTPFDALVERVPRRTGKVVPALAPAAEKGVEVILSRAVVEREKAVVRKVSPSGVEFFSPLKPSKVLTPVTTKVTEEQFPNLVKRISEGGIESLQPRKPAKVLTPIEKEIETKMFPDMVETIKDGITVLEPKKKTRVLTPVDKKDSVSAFPNFERVMSQGVESLQPRKPSKVLTPVTTKVTEEQFPNLVKRVSRSGVEFLEPKKKTRVLTPSEKQGKIDLFPGLERKVSESGVEFFKPRKPVRVLTPSGERETFRFMIEEKDVFGQRGLPSTVVLPKPIRFGAYGLPFVSMKEFPVFLESGVGLFEKKPSVRLVVEKKPSVRSVSDVLGDQEKVLDKRFGVTAKGQRQQTVQVLETVKETRQVTKKEPVMKNLKKTETKTVKVLEKESVSISDPLKGTIQQKFLGRVSIRSPLFGVVPVSIKDTRKDISQRKALQIPVVKGITVQENRLMQKMAPVQRTKVVQRQRTTQMVSLEQAQVVMQSKVQQLGSRQMQQMEKGLEQKMITAPAVLMVPDTRLRSVFGGMGQVGYDVFVKPRQYRNGKRIREGRFSIKKNKKPLTRTQALNLGHNIVDKNEKASFKIVETTGKPSKRRVGGERFMDHMFDYNDKGNGVYTEKSIARIDSPGELREITFKGVEARRRGKGSRSRMGSMEKRLMRGMRLT